MKWKESRRTRNARIMQQKDEEKPHCDTINRITKRGMCRNT